MQPPDVPSADTRTAYRDKLENTSTRDISEHTGALTECPELILSSYSHDEPAEPVYDVYHDLHGALNGSTNSDDTDYTSIENNDSYDYKLGELISTDEPSPQTLHESLVDNDAAENESHQTLDAQSEWVNG